MSEGRAFFNRLLASFECLRARRRPSDAIDENAGNCTFSTFASMLVHAFQEVVKLLNDGPEVWNGRAETLHRIEELFERPARSGALHSEDASKLLVIKTDAVRRDDATAQPGLRPKVVALLRI